MATTTIYGNTINGYWRVYLKYELKNNIADPSKATITWEYGINWVKDVKGNDSATNYSSSKDRPTYVSCTGQSQQNRYPNMTFTKSNTWAGRMYPYGSGTFSFKKDTTAKSVTLTASIKHVPTTYTLYKGTSSKSITLTIAALQSYNIAFDKNTDANVENIPPIITKYYGIGVQLPPDISTDEPPIRDGWGWYAWNTQEDLQGTTYKAGDSFNGNANTILYAMWGATDPPTCESSDLAFSTSGDDVIRGFTDVSCDISNIKHKEGRIVTSVKMVISGHESNARTTDGMLKIEGSVFTSDDDGTHTVYIETLDDAGAIGSYPIGVVTIVAPTWGRKVIVNNTELPQTDARGFALLDSFEVLNSDGTYDTMDLNSVGIVPIDEETQWAFDYVFDENHVDDPTELNPSTSIRFSYKHYHVEASLGNKAFYTTTRNQNYSNGIYNVVFVGGVDNTLYPDYSSRAWWSKINDPLYFPDTNYIEVGSNDTVIQGLTKVGDYLGIVKQSKTTDTAIFLIYPTSFEEDTTYAVKQGVQGVGALSRYSFNILGDETLFLSPKGVMAIVPTQDEEHKVQNRSYYVDKRLLAETGVESAYSFVFDGKYFLSIGNGHCYVLDGNQRNSWGNDKTNLVYECYYLENVPANCFVKYQDNLVFSTQDEVCMFGDNYTDAYDAEADERKPVTVSAEWSTILDDDGSLHYYKTMQKKGNLVSILPLENEKPYKVIAITEDVFNEDKSMYYVLEDGKYVQCTDSYEFSETTDYYIENRSNTRVLVKKDDNDPIEIERKFGLQSDIPSEMYFNKKFKKYKRLQFIIRNDADEDFGIDEIVKNYILGNYAKK